MRQTVSAKKMQEIFQWVENSPGKILTTRKALEWAYTEGTYCTASDLLFFVLSQKEIGVWLEDSDPIDEKTYSRERDRVRAYKNVDFATIARYEKT